MCNTRPMTMPEVIKEVERLEEINVDLLAACKTAIKVLAPLADDEPGETMLVSQLTAAVDKATANRT